jgi:hypothetical protein
MKLNDILMNNMPFPYPTNTHECHVCKGPVVDGKCPANICVGTDVCVICGCEYAVTEEWMIYGYCPDHEGDM